MQQGLSAVAVSQRALETQAHGAGGPPHLWLQRGEAREAVLIHHRCHHLECRTEGEGPGSTVPTSCGLPKTPFPTAQLIPPVPGSRSGQWPGIELLTLWLEVPAN